MIIVDLGLEKRETITKKWLLVGLRWPRFVTVSWITWRSYHLDSGEALALATCR